MNFSIITPSYKQLDWLRLCVASVADQNGVGSAGGRGAKVGKWKSGKVKSETADHAEGARPHPQEYLPTFSPSDLHTESPLAVEHIIQDAGTPGIENFQVSSFRSHPSFSLKVFSEKDAGMYDAINRGLKKATGDICAWLNCDEQYLPGTLARVSKFFAEHPETAVLFGDAILVDAGGEALSYRRTVLPGRLHTRLVHLNTLSCATFFRRSIVDRGFLFEPAYKLIGDGVWIDKLLQAKISMATIPQPFSVFTFTGSNLGERDASEREQKEWASAADAPPHWLKRWAMIANRWHKFRAGAYRKRDLSYEIYALHNWENRIERRAFGVPYHWPRM